MEDQIDLIQIRIAFELSKSVKRDRITGKALSNRKFAKHFLNQDASMVSKVLSGNAKSKPVMNSILRFIKESKVEVDFAVKEIDLIIKNCNQ